MKEDQKGPKNGEIILGLGYSKIQLDVCPRKSYEDSNQGFSDQNKWKIV